MSKIIILSAYGHHIDLRGRLYLQLFYFKTLSEMNIDYSVIPDFEECLPRITLIIPYSTRSKSQSELNNWLTFEVDQIEKDLLKNYSEEKTTPIIKRLRHLIETVSPATDGKNIGILLSPCIEKVYYFNATDPSRIYSPRVLVKDYSLHAN